MAATIPTNGIVLNSGLDVADGDITIASGHGISFAATSDGTGTDSSELLDDYEEGTFTPSFTSSGATIEGLPFTAGAGFAYLSGRAGGESNHYVIQVNSGQTAGDIYKEDDSGITNVNLSGDYVLFSGTYITA